MNRNIYSLFSLLLLPLLGLFSGDLDAQVYVSHGVTQAPLLVADAGMDQSGCANDSVMLGGVNTANGGTAPYGYNWNPVLGLNSNSIANPMAAVSSNTSYLVQIVDANNCSAQDTVDVMDIGVLAAFSSVATNLSVAFTDMSAGTGNGSWFWTFGDGNSSTSQNPTHTYNMAGTYTVCFSVNAGTTCADSVCQTVTVTMVGLEAGIQGSLSIYPNPASGNVVNFELAGMNLTEDVVIEWFDLQGREVNRYVGAAGTTVHRVNRSGVAAGVYEYRLKSGEVLLGAGKLVLE